MLIAVVLNAFSFVLVMGPTFLRSGPTLRANPLNRLSLVTLGHAGAGSLAEILGIWVVASWRLRSSTGKCVGKKKVMLAIALLWLTAILLGILLYVLLYTTML
jgi:hypothetical protein